MEDLNLIIFYSTKFEAFLGQHLAATGLGLINMAKSVRNDLPKGLYEKLARVAAVRNPSTHVHGHIPFKNEGERQEFKTLCEGVERELERLMTPSSFVRTDGRAVDQLRPVRLTPGYLPYAEGSVLIEMGQTRVVCSASLEDRVPPFLRHTGQGWVTAEYAMLPRATLTRSQRASGRGGPSGRTHEIQRLIGRSIRAVADMNVLGERTVTLDCDVLQADGGTRTAAITGAYVAFALASARLQRTGKLSRSLLAHEVAAVSVGIVDGVPLLDLKYDEDSRAEVDMNLVCTSDGRLIEIQGTAEREPFTTEQMNQMLALAQGGIAQLIVLQREALAG